jgi:ABC-type microcin C transport system permease subunit YejB
MSKKENDDNSVQSGLESIERKLDTLIEIGNSIKQSSQSKTKKSELTAEIQLGISTMLIIFSIAIPIGISALPKNPIFEMMIFLTLVGFIAVLQIAVLICYIKLKKYK